MVNPVPVPHNRSSLGPSTLAGRLVSFGAGVGLAVYEAMKSQDVALANARLGATEVSRRRLQINEVELFFAERDSVELDQAVNPSGDVSAARSAGN